MMQTLIYDGTFAGLLSAVFDIYEYRFADVHVVPQEQVQANIFGQHHIVHTDEQKAQRVWKGLGRHISKAAGNQLYKTFLSEQPEMPGMLVGYIRHAFANTESIENDYAHHAVRYVMDMAKIVHREKHRMEAFVRFQRTNDDLYHATVEPDYNVLPLILSHFKKRYADQRWLIYDIKRSYGIYYDLLEVQYVNISFNTSDSPGGSIATILDTEEMKYQHLWQKYFHSANIPARKNMKLHIKHMPRRYWRYLTEKQDFG